MGPILKEFFALFRVPLETDDFDFGATKVTLEIEALARRNAGKLIRIRPPADALMFFRAFGGQSQNLRALGAAGNFRELFESVFERATQSATEGAALESTGRDSAA